MALSGSERAKRWRSQHKGEFRRMELTLSVDEHAELKRYLNGEPLSKLIRRIVANGEGQPVNRSNDTATSIEPIGDEKEIERIGQALLDSLPKNSQAKALRNVEKLQGALQAHYERRYWDKVREKMKDERKRIGDREKELKEETERLVKFRAGIKPFMSEQDYKAMAGILHPDRANGDTKLEKRLNRLTVVWNKIGVNAGWRKR